MWWAPRSRRRPCGTDRGDPADHRSGREILQILRDQFRLGFAMRIDVAAQEAALGRQDVAAPLQKQLEQTRDLLRALVGNLPNQDVSQIFELEALQLPPELPLSLPPGSSNNVRCAGAEAQLHAANASRRCGAAMLRNSQSPEILAATRTNSPGCSAAAALLDTGRRRHQRYSKAARCCTESAPRALP